MGAVSFLSAVATFIVQFGCKWIENFFVKLCRVFLSFLKIGTGQAVPMTLHLRVYRPAVWHYDRKERPDNVFILRRGTHRFAVVT